MSNYDSLDRTIARWKDDGEMQSFSGNSDRPTILNTSDGRSLKRLIKVNWRKSVQQLTSMFNEGPKKISAGTMLRELKEMGIRKPLVSHW